MIQRISNITFLLFWAASVFAQIPDSVKQQYFQNSQDTSQVEQLLARTDTLSIPTLPDSLLTVSDTLSGKKKKKQKRTDGLWYRVWRQDYPNPKKALILSFVMPGSGQIYNKRWWKLPLVYGALVGMGIAIDFNSGRYKIFRDAYIADLAMEPHLFSNTGLDAGDLKRFRDFYDKNRQLSYIGFVAVYLVQGAEAFVDAHLRTFDVSEDLSLKISPNLDLSPYGEPIVGVGLSFQFSKKEPVPRVFFP